MNTNDDHAPPRHAATSEWTRSLTESQLNITLSMQWALTLLFHLLYRTFVLGFVTEILVMVFTHFLN